MVLRKIKVMEFAGLAPGPFCGMIFADFGASVIRIDKIDSYTDVDYLSNGKKSIAVNLKTGHGIEIIRKLAQQSDILIEPFRSGVMEQLGLGPNVLLKDNPQLIYARLTGFGQIGPYSKRPGHDINFLSLSGLLSRMKWWKNQPPNPPLNLMSDFAGGGLMCAFGILMALYERDQGQGCGQVIDCSMTEGSAYLGSWIFRSKSSEMLWPNLSKPGQNMLDGGRHFYNVYETKDHKYMAVGAIEPQFYNQFLTGLKLDSNDFFIDQFDTEHESEKFAIIKNIFLQKSQNDWCQVFDKVDACVTPVLDFDQVVKHAHNVDTFYENGVPKRAPKFSKIASNENALKKRPMIGEHTVEILLKLGYSLNDINDFKHRRIVFFNKSKL